MPKQKPANKLSDKEQFERFKEAARELGVDETGKDMEKSFQKIAQAGSKEGDARK